MMNKQFFTLYQYLGPLLLTPLSFWLWWNTYEGDLALIMVAWLIPILFAYIVPGIGTNVMKVWEFNTRYRLGKFRPHHGFVFGSATSMMAWLCHLDFSTTFFAAFQMGFIVASVLGFWNLIYDIKALKSGILLVYNQPWADGKDDEVIAMDYAPVFFAGFGLVYGVGIGMAEMLQTHKMLTPVAASGYVLLLLVLSIAFPVALYRYYSYKNHGHSGCKPIKKI